MSRMSRSTVQDGDGGSNDGNADDDDVDDDDDDNSDMKIYLSSCDKTCTYGSL